MTEEDDDPTAPLEIGEPTRVFDPVVPPGSWAFRGWPRWARVMATLLVGAAVAIVIVLLVAGGRNGGASGPSTTSSSSSTSTTSERSSITAPRTVTTGRSASTT